MDNEEFLDILKQVNTFLDVQLSRLDSIERMNPNQAQYLKQMHKTLFKGECCAPCYVIPSESDCTGGTGTGRRRARAACRRSRGAALRSLPTVRSR